jgi:hypothetical protein
MSLCPFLFSSFGNLKHILFYLSQFCPVFSKDFDQQKVNNRLSAIASAIEMLKTHSQPIEPEEVFFLASRLEKWALGN